MVCMFVLFTNTLTNKYLRYLFISNYINPGVYIICQHLLYEKQELV